MSLLADLLLYGYGYIQYTGDMDIFISGSKENADRMLTVMIRFGFNAYELGDFYGHERFVSIGHEPYKIDILTKTYGIDFVDAYKNRNIVELENLKGELHKFNRFTEK